MFSRPFGREVLTPGNHIHLKRLAYGRHLRAQAAQAHQPQSFALQPQSRGDLPLPVAGGLILAWDTTHQAQNETPGKLRRRIAQPCGAADDDAAIASRLQINRSIAHRRRNEQFEIG